MHDLNEFRVFRAIAERGSLIRAAVELGLPRSTVSKRLADLEAKLGQSLFKRTTRRVALTSAGQLLYERVSHALDLLEDGARAVRNVDAAVAQRLVISAPPLLAQNIVGSVAGELLRRERVITIEVRSTIDFDPVRDADVDIRISAHPSGRPPPGARVAGYSRREIYAAPSLLAQRSAPVTLADLTPDMLVMRTPWEILTVTRGRRRATLVCGGPLVVEHHETIRDAVLGGALFGVLPRFIAAPYVDRGMLVQVLGEWKFPEIPIAITLAPNPQRSALADEVADLIPAALHQNGLFR
ncbi:LysR family transcriptional regulator [Dyella sp.]|jgi:DNA-binding transcriptional LysR family regulator|uniref:LysR family transcriptional regulator n=1 Tax=Dyella sp. TaxID=1869338 RepID=UPI002D769E17|nr:LysR family transcriptional regulator [Dyella sp.]HET6433787.1 LysR family transcriptional regulator [Dyella sp.]